jgi:hypothetical protein
MLRRLHEHKGHGRWEREKGAGSMMAWKGTRDWVSDGRQHAAEKEESHNDNLKGICNWKHQSIAGRCIWDMFGFYKAWSFGV